MPTRFLPVTLTAALTLTFVAPPEPARAQEPVFTVKDMYYAPANGLTAETDEDFIKQAYRLCAIEMQTARLAVAKTSNAEVKAFAERLLKDHAAIAKALGQWAAKKQFVIKDDDPAMKMKLDKHKALESMSGADFDRGFLAAILDHHSDGIHLVSNEKRNTKDAGLAAFAEETRLTLIAQNNAARVLQANRRILNAPSPQGVSLIR